MSVLDNPLTRTTHNLLIGGILIILVLYLLPVYDMPSGLVSALEWLFETLWAFDFILPVLTMLICFQIVILTELLLASIKFALFLKKHYTSS